MNSIQSIPSCPHLTSLSTTTNNNNPLYKEECTKCYISMNNNKEGLTICIACYNGSCEKHMIQHYQYYKHEIVCNIKQELNSNNNSYIDSNNDKNQILGKQEEIIKLTINNEIKYNYIYTIKCLTCNIIYPRNTNNLADNFINIIEKTDSINKSQDITEWEDKLEMCEHTLCLEQDNVVVANKSKCQSCDISESLWLCFTCGALGCSRKNFDGTGGNSHAIEHFNSTGHPVVCKMGTITPEGNADIYCYACDNNRLDDNLVDHLNHFGIKMSSQVKTAKSMAEMDLELNLNHDWSSVYEAGKLLPLVFGPKRTGLYNLGNSCYMASVFQCVFSLPTFVDRYYIQGQQHLDTCRSKPSDCFYCQMAKVANALNSGEYSQQPADYTKWLEHQTSGNQNKDEMDKLSKDWQPGVPPRTIKNIIANQNSDFKSNKQQDAFEYFLYFLNEVQRRERANGLDPTSVFNFELETRLECTECHRVRYTANPATSLSLRIPIDDPEKIGSDQKIDFTTCLQTFAGDTNIENYNCPQCSKKTRAVQNIRFRSFPEVLLIQMLRFISPNWVPVKMNCSLNISDKIDMEPLRSKGLQANEVEMPGGKSNKLEPNMNYVFSLMEMGFTENACIRAALATKNSGVEDASTWLFNHMEDADINSPIVDNKNSSSQSFDEMAVAQLVSMGFDDKRVKFALSETNGDADRALDWLFSHAEDVLPSQNNVADVVVNNAAGRFALASFITHLGTSTGYGHYVAHVNHDTEWIYYNDSKVSACPELPKDQAYVYVFKLIK